MVIIKSGGSTDVTMGYRSTVRILSDSGRLTQSFFFGSAGDEDFADDQVKPPLEVPMTGR